MKIIDDLLTINPQSRPGRMLGKLQALIMHWTAAPRQLPVVTRDYWESLKDQTALFASAHYVIGCDGSILRCIPESEEAYHVGSSQIDPASGRIYTDWARAKFGEYAANPTTLSPNAVTLGVEMEPIDTDGNFTPETLASARDLAVDICKRNGLNPLSDIGTHNLVVGWKDCPRLWVNHPELFAAFKQDVANLS